MFILDVSVGVSFSYSTIEFMFWLFGDFCRLRCGRRTSRRVQLHLICGSASAAVGRRRGARALAAPSPRARRALAAPPARLLHAYGAFHVVLERHLEANP